jgi:hypothetical protein
MSEAQVGHETDSDVLLAVAKDLMTCEGMADVKIFKCKSGFYIILQTNEKNPPLGWVSKFDPKHKAIDALWQSFKGNDSEEQK